MCTYVYSVYIYTFRDENKMFSSKVVLLFSPLFENSSCHCSLMIEIPLIFAVPTKY